MALEFHPVSLTKFGILIRILQRFYCFLSIQETMGSVLLTEGWSQILLNSSINLANIYVSRFLKKQFYPCRQDVFEESSGKEWNRGTKD